MSFGNDYYELHLIEFYEEFVCQLFANATFLTTFNNNYHLTVESMNRHLPAAVYDLVCATQQISSCEKCRDVINVTFIPENSQANVQMLFKPERELLVVRIIVPNNVESFSIDMALTFELSQNGSHFYTLPNEIPKLPNLLTENNRIFFLQTTASVVTRNEAEIQLLSPSLLVKRSVNVLMDPGTEFSLRFHFELVENKEVKFCSPATSSVLCIPIVLYLMEHCEGGNFNLMKIEIKESVVDFKKASVSVIAWQAAFEKDYNGFVVEMRFFPNIPNLNVHKHKYELDGLYRLQVSLGSGQFILSEESEIFVRLNVSAQHSGIAVTHDCYRVNENSDGSSILLSPTGKSEGVCKPCKQDHYCTLAPEDSIGDMLSCEDDLGDKHVCDILACEDYSPTSYFDMVFEMVGIKSDNEHEFRESAEISVDDPMECLKLCNSAWQCNYASLSAHSPGKLDKFSRTCRLWTSLLQSNTKANCSSNASLEKNALFTFRRMKRYIPFDLSLDAPIAEVTIRHMTIANGSTYKLKLPGMAVTGKLAFFNYENGEEKDSPFRGSEGEMPTPVISETHEGVYVNKDLVTILHVEKPPECVVVNSTFSSYYIDFKKIESIANGNFSEVSVECNFPTKSIGYCNNTADSFCNPMIMISVGNKLNVIFKSWIKAHRSTSDFEVKVLRTSLNSITLQIDKVGTYTNFDLSDVQIVFRSIPIVLEENGLENLKQIYPALAVTNLFSFHLVFLCLISVFYCLFLYF